jgi:tRNA (guanine-N7-)-methyltransferase
MPVQFMTSGNCMRLKSKPWAKPLIQANPQYVITDEMPVELHPHYKKYALEIGTGKGDFIVGKSQQHPDTFFYGIERATTVLAFALKKLLLNPPTNVQLILGDFGKAAMHINPNFFDEIYLNFSDPWPKIRHHKRRLTALGNLEKITRVLKPKGIIYLKTDNEDLFNFSLLNMTNMNYNILQVQRPYQPFDLADVLTEYERFFREKGLPIYRLIAQRSDHVNTL